MDATSDAQTKQKIAEAFHLGELPPDLFSRPITTSHPNFPAKNLFRKFKKRRRTPRLGCF
jgi:hypothetical protein